MTCALCRKNAALRDSHIIPEFLYTALYDEKHRFHVLSDQDRSRYKQSGLYEKLLCGDCEQRFSVHERYVSLLLRGGLPLECEPQGQVLVFRGVDYKALRMFQLSILWRAAVSASAFFKSVALGKHEERLRSLLLRDDPGHPWQYGCVMFTLLHERRVQQDLIYPPIRVRVSEVPCYRFIFGGFAWLYFVASHPHARKIELASLDLSGELRLFKKDISEVKDIKDFGRSLAAQGKL